MSYKKTSFVSEDTELQVLVSEDNETLTISISDMFSNHYYQEVKLDYLTVQDLITELIEQKKFIKSRD
jgi:hypothetical protein